MDRPSIVALLLIVSGGFMDAYTYIAYDHVFTNAQSGNIVLLAEHVARGEWADAAKHLPTLAAFLPGILVGRAIMARRHICGLRPDAAVLAVELVILAASGVVGGPSPATATAAISFAAAMQNTAFKKVGGVAYTSVVTTGNLRSLCEALHAAWFDGDAQERSKAGVLWPICAGFAVGALSGAVITPLIGGAAILCPMAAIGSALLACLREQAT